MKTWTYAEITKVTESMIRYHMEGSEDKDGDSSYRAIHRNFANGAYLLWSRITMGWQEEGDNERLGRLIEARPLTRAEREAE